MEQEKINYEQIMKLGFGEEIQSDKVFYAEHGFEYTIITFYLTKKIYLDWEKETKLCKMVRIDSHKTGNVKNEMPIKDLENLKAMINFFADKKEQTLDYSEMA